MALLFQIYTAARPGEVRAARWGQIDLAKRDWNRPAEMMKGVHAPAHTVTLNDAAVALLELILRDRRPQPTELIFPGQRGGMLSDMTLNKIIRTAKLSYDTHAFRSSFRDWAAEKMSEVPDPVAEAALAHTVPDKVVRAYKRTNFLEMRRKLFDAWGEFTQSAVPNA
jgi:integrase